MPSSETKATRSFGRAFRIVEALLMADILGEARKATRIVFEGSPEYRLISVLTNSEHSLPLQEIRLRCRAGRRAVLRERRLRLALERMERFGTVINVGSRERPRYQMNLLDEGAKVLMSMFSESETTRQAPIHASALDVRP